MRAPAAGLSILRLPRLLSASTIVAPHQFFHATATAAVQPPSDSPLLHPTFNLRAPHTCNNQSKSQPKKSTPHQNKTNKATPATSSIKPHLGCNGTRSVKKVLWERRAARHVRVANLAGCRQAICHHETYTHGEIQRTTTLLLPPRWPRSTDGASAQLIGSPATVGEWQQPPSSNLVPRTQ